MSPNSQVARAVEQARQELRTLQDGLRGSVPTRLKETFQGRQIVEKAAERVEKAALALGGYKLFPWGAHINVDAIAKKATELRAAITAGLPFVPCRCSTKANWKCPECGGKGWLTKEEWLDSDQNTLP